MKKLSLVGVLVSVLVGSAMVGLQAQDPKPTAQNPKPAAQAKSTTTKPKQTVVPLPTGGKLEIEVTDNSKGSATIKQSIFDVKGILLADTTCSCICTSGGKEYKASKTCSSGKCGTCDCSTPTSPKISCG